MRSQSEPGITTRSERGAVVVSVYGSLTSESPNKEQLLSEFSRLLGIGLRRFILDLEPVSNMDSEGVNEIVNAYTLVTDRNGELTFRGAVTISLHDRLTIESDTGRVLGSELSKLLDIGLRSFVLDFEDVSKMESDDITEIVHAYTLVTHRNGELTLANLPRRIKNVLENVQIASLFDR